MPRTQSLIFLGVAMLLGLIAVILANNFLGGGTPSGEASKPGLVQVAVARVPLGFGAKITPETVRMVEWPANAVPRGAYLKLADAVGGAKPRVVLRPLEINEPVLASKLSGEGGRATLSGLISPDKRAAAVRVNDVSGVGGFALPGDMVDVLITRQLPESEQQITDVLVQNVRVIAVDQDANGAADKPTVAKTATLEVSQLEAQKLALAQTVGTLSLALRQVGDMTQGRPATVGLRDLRSDAMGGWASRPQPARYVRPKTVVRRTSFSRAVGDNVEIVRGVATSNYLVGIYAGF
jgi:pilus assembly protein CpaB